MKVNDHPKETKREKLSKRHLGQFDACCRSRSRYGSLAMSGRHEKTVPGRPPKAQTAIGGRIKLKDLYVEFTDHAASRFPQLNSRAPPIRACHHEKEIQCRRLWYYSLGLPGPKV